MSLAPNFMSSRKGHDWYFYIEVGPATLTVTTHLLSAMLCQFWWAVEEEISKNSTAKIHGWYGTSGTSKNKKRGCFSSPDVESRGSVSVLLSSCWAPANVQSYSWPPGSYLVLTEFKVKIMRLCYCAPLKIKCWEAEEVESRTRLTFTFLLRYIWNHKLRFPSIPDRQSFPSDATCNVSWDKYMWV